METYIQNRILQQTDNMPFALGTWKSKNTSIDWLICIYIYTYIYTHIYIHIYIHTYVSTHQRDYVHELGSQNLQYKLECRTIQKFSNMHHHEWRVTAGCGANSCCSRRDRRVEALALSYTRHMTRLSSPPRLHLRLSPPLEHTGHPCLCMWKGHGTIPQVFSRKKVPEGEGCWNNLAHPDQVWQNRDWEMECTHLQCINYRHLYVHNLQRGWSNEKQVGCPGNEHFHPVTTQSRGFCTSTTWTQGNSPFPVGESSSFSLIFPKEVWKVQEESLQLPNSRRHTGVGYSEKRLIFPPIQPMSLETSESDLKKMRTFQYCGSESIANFFPSSHLAPAGTQKPSLLWKRKAFRDDAHRSQLCCCSERSLSTKTTQVQNSRLPPLEALSLLSHILGSDQYLPFSLQKLTPQTKKRERPRVFVTMTQVCAAHVSSAREFLCMAPNHCKTTLTLQDSWHLKHCWAIKFSSLMTGSYSICSH